MRKLIYSSLFAVLLPCICLNNANAQEKDDNIVYNFMSMESPPTYPGGMSSFYKFIGDNLKYPLEAIANNVQGSVLISFIVEKDGALKDIKVNRKLGYGTDEEAVRVLGLSKRWNPGMQNGKPVSVKYNIPIKFAKPNKNLNNVSPQTVEITNANNNGDNTIYNFMSLTNPPQYEGGMVKFYEFIGKNLNYPSEAIKNKIQGSVLMSFIIEKDGALSYIKVDRKLGFGTDEEAVRVLKLSDQWKPGLVDGKAVRVKYNIPIKFSM